MPLRSAQRLGLVTYLVAARVRDGSSEAGGWRYDADVATEAPGWYAGNSGAIGRRIFDFCGQYDLVKDVLSSPNGATIPPWRIATEPRNIVIADPGALTRLLGEQRALLTSLPSPTVASSERDAALINELEERIIRGVITSLDETRMEQLLRTPDLTLRARASRVDAMRLRRLGKLAAAERRADAAIALLAGAVGTPLELAAAHDEAGAIAYHENDMDDALAHFRVELSLLSQVQDATARAGGLARCMRWVAFTTLRTGDAATASRAAAEAETFAAEAADEGEVALSRIATLRVLAHQGQAHDAVHQLAYVSLVAPVTHPAVVLMARRFYAEALYLSGQAEQADVLALVVSSDARTLGLAREADAVANLLRFHRRKDALDALSARDRSMKRDRLDDWQLVHAAGRQDRN